MSSSSDTFIVSLYENQRRYPLKGWISKLLYTDRSGWSSRDGRVPLTKAELESTLPNNFVWVNDWRVYQTEPKKDVSSAVDDEGWEYAFDFPMAFHPKKKFTDWVRRRVWRRRAVRDTHVSAFSDTDVAASPMSSFVFVLPEGEAPADEDDTPPLALLQPTREVEAGDASATAGEDEPKEPEVAKESPKEKPMPKPDPIDEETARRLAILKRWERHQGSRQGKVTVNVEELHIREPMSTVVNVRYRGAQHRTEPKKFEECHEHVGHEAHFAIADDEDPLVFEIHQVDDEDSSEGQLYGEAVLSLRVVEMLGKHTKDVTGFAKVVTGGGGYHEMGSVTLQLHPKPVDEDNNGQQLSGESLGNITVAYTFEVRDPHADFTSVTEGDSRRQRAATLSSFCSVCGHVQHRCTCTEKSPLTPTQPTKVEVDHGVPPSRLKRGRLLFRPVMVAGLGASNDNAGKDGSHVYVIIHFAGVSGPRHVKTVESKEGGTFPGRQYVVSVEDAADSETILSVFLWEHHRFSSDRCLGCHYFHAESMMTAGIHTLKLMPRANEFDDRILQNVESLGTLDAVVQWIPFTL